MDDSSRSDLDYENSVVNKLNELIDNHTEELAYYWRFGDGCGGALVQKIIERVNAAGYNISSLPPGRNQTTKYSKKQIKQSLSKKVFERDMYRCKYCGTHLDLTVDHIYPELMGEKRQ